MARDRRKMALYEAIDPERLKAARSKTLEKQDKPPHEQADSEIKKSEYVHPWPKKPRQVQVFADRVEFSLSWHVLAISALILLLLMIVVFRLGQRRGAAVKNADNTNQAKVNLGLAGDFSTESALDLTSVGKKPETTGTAVKEKPVRVEPMEQQADHVILITRCPYTARHNLLPVQNHFRKIGIETEILRPPGENVCLLITKKRYENPVRKGSDGAKVLEIIKEHGLKYQTPAGYDGFGPKPFQDALAVNVNKVDWRDL